MKKRFKLPTFVICIAMVMMTLGALTGCNGPLGTITFNDATLIGGYTGVSYDYQLTAAATTGTSISFALAADSSLPAGLNLSTAGRITGTPTTAVSAATFSVVASAAGFYDTTATFTLAITQSALSFANVIIAVFAGQEIDTTLAATGAPAGASIIYTLGAETTLPAWLTFANGRISAPYAEETINNIEFSVTASLPHFTSATADITVGVTATDAISFMGIDFDDAIIDTLFEHALEGATFSQTPVSFAEYNNSLPTWLELENGVLSGTPAEADIANDIAFYIQATATGYGNVVRRFTISVTRQPQNIDFEAAFTNLLYLVAGGLGYGDAFPGPDAIYTADTSDVNVTGLIGTFFVDGLHQWFDPADPQHGEYANLVTWWIYSHESAPITVPLSINMSIRVPGHYCFGPTGTVSTGPGGHTFWLNNDIPIPIAPGQIEINKTTSNLYFTMFPLGNITLTPGLNNITFRRGQNSWDPDGAVGPAIELLRIRTAYNIGWAPGFPDFESLIARGLTPPT